MLYNQQTKELYVRAETIVVNNPLNGLEPSVTFHEQYATTDGEAIQGRTGSCSLDMPADVEETFALVHPVTGDSLGEASFGTLQVMLHSLYLHVASLRDNQVPEDATPEEPEA